MKDRFLSVKLFVLLLPTELFQILNLLILGQDVGIRPSTFSLLCVYLLPGVHLGKVDKSLTRFAKMGHLSQCLLPKVDLLVQVRRHRYKLLPTVQFLFTVVGGMNLETVLSPVQF